MSSRSCTADCLYLITKESGSWHVWILGKSILSPRKYASPFNEENVTEIWDVMPAEGLLINYLATNHLNSLSEITELAIENLQRGYIEFHFN
jgi:hypothetical protein